MNIKTWMLLIGTQIIVKNSNVTEKTQNNDFFGAAPREGRGNLSFYKLFPLKHQL